MSDNGYNPLRWNCSAEGCYNIKQRPKIEIFSDCFPGNINFGDLDASLVEINQRALLLEWKGSLAIPLGQELTYKNLSRTNLFIAIVVVGDAETMAVTHYRLYIAGSTEGWVEADLSKVKAVLKRWADKARKLPSVLMRKSHEHERISNLSREEWIADCNAHEHEFDELLQRLGGRRAAA